MADAINQEAGFARRFVRQYAREPALREPGRRQAREPEPEQRVSVRPRLPPTCREASRHAASAGALRSKFQRTRSSKLATVRVRPMRSLNRGSYQRLSRIESLWQAWRDCRRGKRRRPTVAQFDLDCDRHLFALQRDLLTHRYRPSPWRLHSIRDPKTRLIAAPAVRDRVLHHAVLNEIGPVFERRFLDQSFAAGRGRGPHRAVLYALGCQRRYDWRLHLDISAYFLSIEHDRLLALLAERIGDTDTLELLRLIVTSSRYVYRSRLATQLLGSRCPIDGTGLPLGSWFSQWCGNFYLDALDHFIKRTLKIPAYARYMDDMLLFAHDPEHLHHAHAAIAEWLAQQRGLTLNPKYHAVEPTRTPIVFLGYRVSQAGITPSRKLRRRFRSRLQVAANKGETALIRTIRSYQGLLLFP